MSTPLDTPFVGLAADSCPAYDEMLVALEREFRAVHREAVADALDEAARPLFELADAAPEEQVLALARAGWQALPYEGDEPPHWLLACALEDRCASGAVRAAVAAELARRAGIEARPVRLRGCWAIRVPGHGGQVAADVGEDASQPRPDRRSVRPPARLRGAHRPLGRLA